VIPERVLVTIIGGPLIKIARLRAGFTQRELAERLALPQSSIARWESGARQPTIDNLVEAVRACGLDVTVALHAMDRSNDGFIWGLLDETPPERLRRQVAAANALGGGSGKDFDPIRILRGLSVREVRFVLLGRLAETLRGSPLVPGAEVVICRDTTAANRVAFEGALRDLDARVWRNRADRPEEPPFELRPFARADRWWVDAADGALAVVDTPQGTDGFGDLIRQATREPLARDLEVQVASLLDLVRIADASVASADRGGLPTLRRAYELGLDYLPPGERPVEIPEGLVELFAEHGITPR
jgi:transcriptional regulator with XRE-family HTH domain